ncbi:MAG: PP2C family protein-serine/threonine phosphatase [Acidobacteriaceae bacterium]
MRAIGWFLLLAPLWVSLPRAAAQGTPAMHAQVVTLGNSTVELTGPWKFHTGDDMAWAHPGFDDSAWSTMDLTPPTGSYDPQIGSSGYVPGWTARGYRGYSGYAWYRLRTEIHNGQTALTLKMPDNYDDAYQVYLNGQLIGQFGRFTSHGVTAYVALPRAFSLPANVSSGPATIAIRMWMAAFTPMVDQDAGGLHGPPVLGQASAIVGLLQLDWDAVNRSLYVDFVEIAILLVALLVAFGLFWLDRSEPAYLWLGLTCAAILARVTVIVVTNYTTWIGVSLFLIEDAILTPAYIGLWVLFWAYWFRLDRLQLHRAVWGLVVLLGVMTAMLRWPLYGSVVPVHAIAYLLPLTYALKLLLGALLVWVTIGGILKDRAEGWMALPAVVLVVLSLYQQELVVLHFPGAFFPYGIAITLNAVATVLSLAIITVLLLRRFLQSQRQREQLKQEIEQARQVQHVLIPEALPVIPGIALESEYRPAQQVGGDFFQIIAGNDGSVLAVIGDVSGKGLKAAMLVSLIVGTIRNQAETDLDPLRMLQSLNRRLIGRGDANATCLALHIAPDGGVTLANAGHLPPYWNGKEIAMEGALPLGVTEDAEFSVMQLALQPGDRLTLLTDGIVEAQNETRELFGFARISELMRQHKSAVEIAAAAQSFGQNDDITVLRVEFSGAPQPALAH